MVSGEFVCRRFAYCPISPSELCKIKKGFSCITYDSNLVQLDNLYLRHFQVVYKWSSVIYIKFQVILGVAEVVTMCEHVVHSVPIDP